MHVHRHERASVAGPRRAGLSLLGVSRADSEDSECGKNWQVFEHVILHLLGVARPSRSMSAEHHRHVHAVEAHRNGAGLDAGAIQDVAQAHAGPWLSTPHHGRRSRRCTCGRGLLPVPPSEMMGASRALTTAQTLLIVASPPSDAAHAHVEFGWSCPSVSPI
jgi:hypothetical protein